MISKDEKARRKRLVDAHAREQHAAQSALMPIDRDQLEDLLDAVDQAVTDEGCDHTRRATVAWAREHDVDVGQLNEAFDSYAVFCDCEIVLNIETETVFGPTRG
ncbi:DUF2695 domain-containing protein [Blastococcus sp. SYSU D00820]